ncbi:uncharacterized protein MELLADRAFT_104662 [Melampsora larici-populina 98AG31]|uniref:Uncharacterized protein n=1 Tax=Melampsora larici-populina (strain 98AG31 / pathotype 3-4-7) TaxID=747676 RepID=F4RFH5_MELLP|nr:uncharacterized protein MELLADRAFT_104662 [Melampsora larici-populina 98AG31]EGG08927.1 hypothetical protein MELLADRAFT_104662 [Melampsora larici-populina 98AG31]
MDDRDGEGSDTETGASDLRKMDDSGNAEAETLDSESSLPATGYLSAEDDDRLLFALENMNLESNQFPETSLKDDHTSQEDTDGFSEDEALDNDLSDYEEAYGDEPGFQFFDKNQNLAALQDIAKNIRLPSWVGRVPSTVGTRKGGKLKADEWVILFQVMIIPAIISVLNKEDGAANFTDHDFVRNVLHLISVVNIVRRVEVTENDVRSLRYHLRSYRNGYSKLYRSLPVLPNHHMALHLPECIRRFGPAPFWTAWSFERLNDARGPTTYRWGRINEIFITKPGPKNNPKAQLWFEVIRFSELRAAEKAKHGLDNWPNARMTVVYSSPKKKELVRVDELVAQGVAWDTPDRCFGINQPTTLIINLSKFLCNQT